MANFIAINLCGDQGGGDPLGGTEVLMLVIFVIAIIFLGVYIYDYYRKERASRPEEYRLYKITFVVRGETFTQLICSTSAEDAETIFYMANKFSESDVKILEIK